MRVSVNVIGAGNLGKTLGHLFVQSGQVDIHGIYNTSQATAQTALSFIGQGESYTSLKTMPAAMVNLITTPDRLIAETCVALCENPVLRPGSIFLHCSGALSSDILSAAKLKKCHVASLHPAGTFADPASAVCQFTDTFCAIEGDEAALTIIAPLFQLIGGNINKINKAHKGLYHIGGVFASNYMVTLAEQAKTLFIDAGIQAETALDIVIHLMRNTLVNLEQLKSPSLALTGPIQRNDLATIHAHLKTLSNSQQKALYMLLGQVTLGLTPHTPEIRTEMMKALVC